MTEGTKAELARLVGVHPSTVGRALTTPGAPEPTNPGQPQARYRVKEFLEWWPNRRLPGRPRKKNPRTE